MTHEHNKPWVDENEDDPLWDDADMPMPRIARTLATDAGARIEWGHYSEPEVPLDVDVLDEAKRSLREYRRELESFNYHVAKLWGDGHSIGKIAWMLKADYGAVRKAIYYGRRDYGHTLSDDYSGRTNGADRDIGTIAHDALDMHAGRLSAFMPGER